MTNFQRTANWLTVCGKEPGNVEHISVQIGVMLEEMREVLELLRFSTDGAAEVQARTVNGLEYLATILKTAKAICHVPTHERAAFLKELCDVDVTINAVAFVERMDKDSADAATLDSNDSKLDENGQPVILPGGKIGKSDRYLKPELKGFV